MCNQELFDQYGLEIPETMDDLYQVSEVFNENGITPLALGEKINGRVCFLLESCRFVMAVLKLIQLY